MWDDGCGRGKTGWVGWESVDADGLAEALGDEIEESCDALLLAGVESAIDLHEGKDAGAADIDGGHQGLAAGVIGHDPGAGVADADQLAEVAAPDADLGFVVEVVVFGKLGEDGFKGIEGLRLVVEGLMKKLSGELDGGGGVGGHHGFQIGIDGGRKPCFERVPFW